MTVIDESDSQYYDYEFHSGLFFAEKTGSTLLVDKNNNKSDKCDDGGVVLQKTMCL